MVFFSPVFFVSAVGGAKVLPKTEQIAVGGLGRGKPAGYPVVDVFEHHTSDRFRAVLLLV